MVGQEAEGDGGCEVCGGLFGLVISMRSPVSRARVDHVDRATQSPVAMKKCVVSCW